MGGRGEPATAVQATVVSRRLASMLLSTCVSLALVSIPSAFAIAHEAAAKRPTRVAFAATDRLRGQRVSRGASRALASVVTNAITVIADGHQTTVITPATSVGELLGHLEIVLGPDD